MDTMLMPILAFVGVACLAAIIFLVFGGEKTKLDERLEKMSTSGTDPASIARAEQQRMNQVTKSLQSSIGHALVQQQDEKERSLLKSRLVQAGFYNPAAPGVFLVVKAIVMFVPIVLGVGAWALGIGGDRAVVGLFAGAVGSVIGMVGSSFWLDSRKKARQTIFRRSLPDAMDVIVICLEGGLALPAAVARVADELRVAHPVLAFELTIVQREIQLGKNTGEALKEFSRRSDLEEVRSLAAVIQQAEKYGASMAKALRIHAESLRLRRTQAAEEMAAKAATKVLFPTLLFIFPAVFVVILGPAAYQIMDMFAKTGN